MLALSPRCWPVSPFCYMDEPGRFFPAALRSPLDEFAAFCRRSEYGGRGCAGGLVVPSLPLSSSASGSSSAGKRWECPAELAPALR